MSQKNGENIKCPSCGKINYFPLSRLRNGAKYCNLTCSGISKKGIIPRMAFKKNDPRITGIGNYQWSENASYTAKHRWINKWGDKKTFCEHCNANDRKIHWANISGKYLRELNDWLRLCISCHRKFDRHGEKSRITWYKNHPTYSPR